MSNQPIKVHPSDDVLFQILDDEAVLLHLASERYFGLNSVGSQVWQLIQDGHDQDSCIALIVDKYDAPEETVRRDVILLIDQLAERGLVTVVAS